MPQRTIAQESNQSEINWKFRNNQLFLIGFGDGEKTEKSTSRAIPEHVHWSVVEGSEVLGRRTRELAREPPRGNL